MRQATTPAATQPLYVYYHTHWDREWYLPFRQYQHRLLTVVDELLDALDQAALPCFTLDGQTVVLDDYLALRPENEARIKHWVAQERLSVGPWFVMPDEFLVSGESLVRNLQRGMAMARRFGETTFTGYLPDTFGHSADIPMILRQFGMDTAVVWRGVSPQRPFFKWQSPSGDSVLTYHLTEGYFQNAFHMGHSEAEKTQAFDQWQQKVREIAGPDLPILYPLGADHLGLALEAPQMLSELAPDARAVTIDRFMQLVQTDLADNLQTITGELRDCSGAYILPGVFSSRLYLKQWNRRMEWRLTRQLEQLLVWQQLLDQRPVFEHELDWLWKTLLLNHPHDSICGCSVDPVHQENEDRFRQIDQFSQAMLGTAHAALAKVLQPSGSQWVLNLTDAPYTGVVEVTQDYPLSKPVPPPLPHQQVLSETEILDEAYRTDVRTLPLSENKALRRRSLVWVEDVPPHGFQVTAASLSAPDPVVAGPDSLENSRVLVKVTPAGDLTITDKQSGRIYSGIHQLWHNLEQGDSYNAAPLPGTPAEQATLTRCRVQLSGPLLGSLQLDLRFRAIQMAVTTTVSLAAGSDQVVFETSLTNNTPDQKIQAWFETATLLTTVVAEGHFAPITRTYDPAYDIAAHMPAPRLKELPVNGGPIQRFVGFDGQTLITEGLTEYEVGGNALKLTLLRAFGMLSRDDTGVRGSHAGPPLPTPEGQCLGREITYRYAWRPGFDVVTAYAQADVFYGGVYGFDRCGEATQDIPTVSRSFFQWEVPGVVSTATVPQPDGTWHLRLINPTGKTQPIVLTELPKTAIASPIDLTGKPVADAVVSEKLAPYRLQTWRISTGGAG